LPFFDNKPDRMHSFRPVPRMMTSYTPSASGLYVLPLKATSAGMGALGSPIFEPRFEVLDARAIRYLIENPKRMTKG